jgi:peptidyl-dipeptidase Dcp
VKKIILFLVAAIFFSTACSTGYKQEKSMNPFLKSYGTPFDVPPFDKIENKHFIPAIEEGIKQEKKEIEKIVNTNTPPTFANTILAMEYSGKLLKEAQGTFFNLSSANTDDEIQEIAKKISPLLSKHKDEILLNEKLFSRVKEIYAKHSNYSSDSEQAGLNKEEAKLLEEVYKSFVRGGANLDNSQKEELKKINEELSILQLKFGENMLKETNNYQMVIENEKDLDGLPESVRAAAADDAKNAGMDGKWLFTLHKPSWIPFVTYCKNRELREKIYKAMYNRGNNDNDFDSKSTINKIINLRLQKANLMGFENWSAYMLDNRMAKKPENVYALLNKIWDPALKRAKEESDDMQKMIKSEGGNFKLESWDWWYYSEKVRKAKFDLDEEQIRPYFELNNVLNGAFTVSEKLYGLTFTELNDMPLYHSECRVFEVKDNNNSHVGILYTDFHPRASKRGGAWMTSYRKQYHDKENKDVRPVISIVCNFSKPIGDKPALLSYDEVETLFHEFGHALHGLLSQCNFYSLSGTSVARDFVELPSQIMEHWVSQPEVLDIYAKHYKTGETIPKELINKLEKAGKFNQGFGTVEYLAASYLDMDYHTITTPGDIDIDKFEGESMKNIAMIDEIIPRYKSTYFAHIFSGGYSSGYYSYIWAEVLDADAFEAFKDAGSIYDQKTATSFRKNILERGGTDDAMELYINFRGKKPVIEPLLKNRGLN